MGTKKNPAPFDCYAAAHPDEPMFILLGRDPMAGLLVNIWARLRQMHGEDPAKVAEALECATAMDAWAVELGKQPMALAVDGREIAAALGVLEPVVVSAEG